MDRLLFTQKGNRILAVVFWAAGVIASAWLILAQQRLSAGFLPPCRFHQITGYNCVGCGATRATDSLLHLQLLEAFRYNPLYCVALIFFFIWITLFTVNAFRKNYKQPFAANPTTAVFVALVIVLVTFGILRNTPFYHRFFY